MNTIVKYLANDLEDAVVKVMQNGDRYVKLYPDTSREIKARPRSVVAFNTQENDLFEISKEDYETFGKEWHFGGLYCNRTPL